MQGQADAEQGGGRPRSRLWPLQTFAFGLLGVITLFCVHEAIYNLRDILVPFMLSGFLVLAVEPTVELLYRAMAGRRPFRQWCCCLCQRLKPGRSANSASVPFLWGFEGVDGSSSSSEEEGQPLLQSGEEAYRCASRLLDWLCRLAAVMLVLMFISLAILSVGALLTKGVMHMKNNWQDYALGMARLKRDLDEILVQASHHAHIDASSSRRIKALYGFALNELQNFVYYALNLCVEVAAGSVTMLTMTFTYSGFWLLRPLPVAGEAGALVRSYVWKKSLVSFLFGCSVWLWFWVLDIDLAIVFGCITFFLNFVPEVGAFISIAIPMPIILLDGRIEEPIRVCLLAFVGQIVLKFMYSNVLELKLIERDREMSIHPVWILLCLNYFGIVWGPVGMLVSVPLMGSLKTCALLWTRDTGEDTIIRRWAVAFQGCLEGRGSAARKRWSIAMGWRKS